MEIATAGTLHKVSEMFGLAKTMRLVRVELQSDTQPIEQVYESQDDAATTFGLAKTMCRVTI